MNICKNCGWQIHDEGIIKSEIWVDELGGDICGLDNRNLPHDPHKSYKLEHQQEMSN